MQRWTVWLLPLFAVLVLAGLIAAHRIGLQDKALDAANDAQVQPPSRATLVGDQVVVRLDGAAQQRDGIGATPVVAATFRPATDAIGVVLGAQGLVPLVANYAQASMHLAQMQAAERMSSAEHQRLLQLNRNGKNASDKAVEAARATWQSDRAALDAAQQALQLALLDVQQQWGKAIAAWVGNQSPQLQQLLHQQMYLVQVTAPSVAHPTANAVLTLPNGSKVHARYLSLAPTADPRLQGASFYYLVPAKDGILPGITVQARLQQAAPMRGAIVPSDAVVLLNGQAWCYVVSGTDQFVRTLVETGAPTAQGWFVAGHVLPGDRVVTTGAQALLSEEFRQQIEMTDD
ncbi:MAG: hypothetical protein ACP5EP_01785 [Acidobacteriaceae bacterium]